MKIGEAIAILEDAPEGESPSRINPSLTLSQAKNIIVIGIAEMLRNGKTEQSPLDSIFEKRVWQIARNQRRPRY